MRPLPLKLLSLLSLLLFLLVLVSYPSPLALIRSSAPPKLPFRSSDLLPLLPWRLARPILGSLRSAIDLLPAFVGAASSPGDSVEWKGACFYENRAWLEYHNESGSPFGGGTLHIKVKHNGVSIFLMPSGMIGTLRALVDIFPLFTNTQWGENKNLAFLKKHMGATFEERPQPWVSEINADDLHSGDFLALSKIRGRWGGFETLEKWVTGAYAGHTAVCLRDAEGKLWVAESGHENEKGEDVIAILPWEEWWDFEVNKDDSNPHIALLPLHPDMRAKFNETAAWEYANSMSGLPYGYHNMIFSWIDTISGNYPPPLDAHVVASFMTMWTKLQPAYAGNMWNEALNKRLGTEGLDLAEIMVESEKQGISFEKLLTIPEQDDWVYIDGKSTSCVVFILGMYKEAGLFEPYSSSIQVSEFTIKDAYSLNFFEDNTTRLPEWCNKDDTVKLPFCQIKGRYRMEFPDYNIMQPYPHMNEKCPSLPPNYVRSNYC
ncbi:hypothetical protein ACMD2_21617 [Ananas comosus]|uniref:Uncharacterized protein n=1 Tax=Ananas comosus TaxID=4615 RepID=A0A199VLA5_ANACO|nr:hypothetical protein ACMD2_21617 [Ananas comosus]